METRRARSPQRRLRARAESDVALHDEEDHPRAIAALSYRAIAASPPRQRRSAKMAAADVVRGDMRLAHRENAQGAFVLDVPQSVELVVENVPGAVNIPFGHLRCRLGELPRDVEILVNCRFARGAYCATRILLQNGFRARNPSGGMPRPLAAVAGPMDLR